MRIAVDATCWSNRRGYGRFARALLTAAVSVDRQNSYVFFVDDETKEFPLPAGVEVVRIAATVPTVKAASANGRRSLRDLWAARQAMDHQKADLVFFPSIYSYVPLTSRQPKLVTIHDAIPELYPKLVFPTWRSKFFWRLKVKLGCAQARLILTVSEFSRRCLAEELKIPVSRLRVVHEASDPAFRRLDLPQGAPLLNGLGLPAEARFLTYVGGFSPHKNLPLLLDVFRELQAQPQFADLYLLLVGDYQGDAFYSCYRQLVNQVQQTGLGGRVVFTGHMGDEGLVALLNLTQALVLPSFCEGFGLPAVEAAACGAPVVVTNCSPIPELLGAGAIAVEPGNRTGWIDALTRLLGDSQLREQMRAAGLAAAGRLSWKNSAQQLLEVFDEVRPDRVATS